MWYCPLYARMATKLRSQPFLSNLALKTPDLKPIRLPEEKKSAAIVIAHEWDSQEQILKPHSLPLVSLMLYGPVL